MEISGFTRMAAVVARPINHSLSPFIHNLAFELTGLDGVYLAWDISSEDLEDILTNVKKLNMFGLNISMPYKQKAMLAMDELTESAQIIGAINTVALMNGKLIGHNTDGIGFFNSLEKIPYNVCGQEITILGGGGAAMAIIVQAILNGAKKVNVFARRSNSYEPLKKKLNELSVLTNSKINLFELAKTDANQKDYNFHVLQEKITQSSLLVNATSIGMDGESMPLPSLICLSKGIVVVDVIYKILKTPFLEWSENQGALSQNGIGMLVYQAAESFKIWTGKEMPVDEIQAALVEKLKLNENIKEVNNEY